MNNIPTMKWYKFCIYCRIPLSILGGLGAATQYISAKLVILALCYFAVSVLLSVAEYGLANFKKYGYITYLSSTIGFILINLLVYFVYNRQLNIIAYIAPLIIYFALESVYFNKRACLFSGKMSNKTNGKTHVESEQYTSKEDEARFDKIDLTKRIHKPKSKQDEEIASTVKTQMSAAEKEDLWRKHLSNINLQKVADSLTELYSNVILDGKTSENINIFIQSPTVNNAIDLLKKNPNLASIFRT